MELHKGEIAVQEQAGVRSAAAEVGESINARHAAVLALVIWYLMMPPVGQQNAPFFNWATIQIFASAGECNTERNKEVAQGRAAKPTNVITPNTSIINSGLFDGTKAECISSDDSRLSKQR